MSDIYHNWERLVRAVQKREEYLELARASSSSFSSIATDFTSTSSTLRLPEGDASSAVSLIFKSDDESDTIWKRLLPPDYKDILARSGTPVVYSSERELYFHLCDSPILLDGGKLSFRLSKPSGKKCYMLNARELSIVWGSTPRYWRWKNMAESRFADVAQLFLVYWLEFYGKMQTRMLSAYTNYAAYLVFKIHEESYGLDSSAEAFFKPIETEDINLGIRQMTPDNVNKVYLQRPTMHRQGSQRRDAVQDIDAHMPNVRRDGWMEIELGEYFVNEGDGCDIVMYFGLLTRCRKSGLIIEGIEIRPKHENNEVIQKSSIPVNMDGSKDVIQKSSIPVNMDGNKDVSKKSIPVKIQRSLRGVFIKKN